MVVESEILLVHGAWSRAATWDAVIAALEASGRRVRAIDLPGHGDDATPPETVTLDHYVNRIVEALPTSGPPALLVGHSMGGISITAAAERAPERIRKLAYVAAFLPRDGESLLDLVRQGETSIRSAVRPGPTEGATVLDPASAAAFLCQDASPEQQARMLALIGPQPNAPQTTPVKVSEARFGRLPRAYVFCEQDRTVPPRLQRAMVDASPCAETVSLPCGHLPQLTAVEALAAALSRF